MKRATAVAAFAATAVAPAVAQSLVRLEVGGVPEDGITPALWAQHSGLFRRNGLDVHVNAQRAGAAVTAGVVGGAYQLGKASIMSLIGAHVHGLPIVLVFPAGIYRSNPHSGLIVRADSPIRTGADLNGKLVAVSALSDLYAIGTYAWVDQHGGDWTSLKLVELPVGAVFDAVVSGRVDVGGTVDPYLRSALDTQKVRFLADTDAAIAPIFLATAWFTTADYARDNARVIAAFRATLREAAAYAQDHHAETVDVFAAFTGMEPSVVARMTRMVYGEEMDPKLVQPVINAAAKYKIIPAGFDAKDIIAP